MKKKPFVYVAGPLSRGDPLEHTHKACMVATRLVQAGIIPFVPHLSITWQLVTPQPYRFWLDMDLAIIERCDALLRLPGASPGADEEVAHARSLGIPVFFSEDELIATYSHSTLCDLFTRVKEAGCYD